MIYLLFGEMGVGKNFVGERMARQLGCPFLDGDDAIPDWMMWKVERFRILLPDELDRYVAEHLLPAIWSRHEPGMDLVVAQALYRRRHRRMVIEWGLGHARGSMPPVVPVWVRPPSLAEHARRLLGREHGPRWLMYAMVTKPFFQRPDRGTDVVVSGSGKDLAWQIRGVTGGWEAT